MSEFKITSLHSSLTQFFKNIKMEFLNQCKFSGFLFFCILTSISEKSVLGFSSGRESIPLNSNNGDTALVNSSIDFESRVPRVVGGRVAQPKEYPYMVAIYLRARPTSPVFVFTCGASIYNKNYIITAAHCLYFKQQKVETKDVRILIGETQLRLLLREDTPELLPVSTTFPHPGFDTSENALFFATGDIAVIKMTDALKYSTSVKKLRIASPRERPLDGLADVTGWGRTSFFSPHRPSETELPVSLALKTARLRMIPRQLCTLRHLAIIPQSILCVGSEGIMDFQSACFGDSGGPLACMGPSGPYLCGIVSTGIGCGLRFTPAFYTDVSKYFDWIRNIGGDQ